ncbi:Oidioi.mRNA.OKI2018_I69.chr1.g3924.t1.cds [Oikopleura dioica]|uniref:Oidioi.mRNA.OKI2018_I69.chr1.g3924.t1.cds n=1 Tax=Oikopleura dioica TaxID=34765 RepID=A0ABN7T2F7_OIKDI|nr:Oidioi.mRNA.OKI2018_I69.chr1.g3924.t1.cds [Oikopleura dioica]
MSKKRRFGFDKKQATFSSLSSSLMMTSLLRQNERFYFEFADSDSLLVEIEEQYAYVECTDFTLKSCRGASGTACLWLGRVLDCRGDDVLLCGLQGGTTLEMRNETIDNPQKDVSPEEQKELDAELIHEIRNCSYHLTKLDYFHKFMRLLLAECKDILKVPMEDDSGHQVLIRLLFSVVYTIVEILRRPPAPLDSEERQKVHFSFKQSLQDSVEYIDDLLMILVDVNSSSLAPVIPMKKAVLLKWKLTLATFEKWNEARIKTKSDTCRNRVPS